MSAAPFLAPAKKRSLRLLIVDDSPEDVTLMAAVIERDKYAASIDHVDSPEGLRSHLATNEYDAILCDHNLRTWTAMGALEIVQSMCKDIPFVVVTGTLGDERAVQYLKDGASDYVLKDRLDRLPSVVERALREKRHRNENARLQRAIWTAKKDWERTFDAIPDSIMLLDHEFRIMRANRATAEVLNLPFSQILGKHCFELVHRDVEPPASCPFLKMKSTSRKEEAEFADPRLHKTLRAITIPLRSEDGKCGAIHVLQDLTESKRLEEALMQAQKLEAVGRLAGGVAHDFNNILSIILGYSELLQQQLLDNDKSIEYIHAIEEAVERAETVISQLLAFSRKQVLQPTVLDLNQVVLGMSEMLRHLMGEDVELVVAPVARLGMVKADPAQIEQVLMNLLVNARDATPRGGTITLATSNIDLPGSQNLGIHEDVVPGSYVVISVSDTGTGMDAETLSHLFEPFFTTKERERGTGLGLAIVYGIVKQSGGYISVQSEPGRGSIFTVYLPRTEEKAEAPTEAALPRLLRGTPATGSILLVEDEVILAKVISTVLESAGYTALQAATAQEAVEVAASYPGTIGLMLSDIVLRGEMDGTELAHTMANVRPEMKVLLMSGYSSSLNGRGRRPINQSILRKPFSVAELQARVREELSLCMQSNAAAALPKASGES